MKASIEFRDDQKPLARAKVPISILGLPFTTAVSAGGVPSDLRFDLSTSFDSGPVLRVSYRPNEARNPFSVVLKTGTGAFGSPVSALLSMSAEFSFLSPHAGGGPAFFLHFKPRFGDFAVVKTTASSSTPPPQPLVNGSAGQNGVYAPVRVNQLQVPLQYPVVRGIDGILSGTEITATSALPLKNRALVKFRWGLRVPSDLSFSFGDEGSGEAGGGGRGEKPLGSWISPRNLPYLQMRKISIKQMPSTAAEVEKATSKRKNPAAATASSEVGALVVEQGMLRKAVEELRTEFERWKGKDVEKRSGDGEGVVPNLKNGRSAVGTAKEEAEEELKKALKGAGGN